MRFVGRRAVLGLEIEGWEVGFVDFAEAEGIGDKAFTSFDFDEVFIIAPTVVKSEVDGAIVVASLLRFICSYGIFFTVE